MLKTIHLAPLRALLTHFRWRASSNLPEHHQHHDDDQDGTNAAADYRVHSRSRRTAAEAAEQENDRNDHHNRPSDMNYRLGICSTSLDRAFALRMIDPIMPDNGLVISTEGFELIASASTMLFPKPVCARALPSCRNPTSLSDTDKRRLASSTSYLTRISPPLPFGNACLSALITSSVVTRPALTRGWLSTRFTRATPSAARRARLRRYRRDVRDPPRRGPNRRRCQARRAAPA